MIGLDWAVFYVPSDTVTVIWETVFTGQKTQPTVSKYWRNTKSTHITQKYNKHTYKHKNTANPLVYTNMGWLRDGSHRGQGRQAWTAVRLQYPQKTSIPAALKTTTNGTTPSSVSSHWKIQDSRQIEKTHNQLEPRKSNDAKKRNKPWFSRLLWQSGNKVGLFYNVPEQTFS